MNKRKLSKSISKKSKTGCRSTPFFTKAFEAVPPEEMEAFYRTVFMHMDSTYACDLRAKYYSTRLRRMGSNVRIGCGVRIFNPQYVSLGDNVSIGDNCALIASSERGIILQDGATLKYGVYLDTESDKGYIDIGERVYIGTRCCLHGHMGLEIGEDTLLAQNVTITPFSHHFDDTKQAIIKQGGHSRKITIGRDCYLGKCTCVLYSADIEDGSVVGAGAVVVKTIPAYSVAVGAPARVIRRRGSKRKKS